MSSRGLASNISFGSVAYCLGGNLFSYNYNSSFRLATTLKPPLQGVWEQPARPVQRETLIHSLFNRKEIKVCIKKLSRRPNIRSFTVIFNFPFGSRKKTKTIKNNYYPEKSSPWAFHLWNSLVNDPFSVVCPPFLYNFPAHSFSVKLNLPTQFFFTVILYKKYQDKSLKRLWKSYSSSESPFFMGHPELHSQELAAGIQAPSPPSWGSVLFQLCSTCVGAGCKHHSPLWVL